MCGGAGAWGYLSEDHTSEWVLVGALLIALLGLEEAIPLARVCIHGPKVHLHQQNPTITSAGETWLTHTLP